MKKFVFLCAALAATAVNAQFKFGPKAGYLNSTITVSSSKENSMKYQYGNKSSFYAGGLAEYKIDPSFSVQAEALYAVLGTSIKFSNSTTDFSAHSLLFPLGFNYYANPAFSVGGGLTIGYIMKIKYKANDKSHDMEDDHINKTNFNPFIGAAYNLKNGLFFDTRYTFGMSKAYENGDMQIKNRYFQVGAGYKF